MLRLFNINVNHSREASSELVKRAVDLGDSSYILFVQEPYLLGKKVAGMNEAGNIHYLQSEEVRSCIVTSKNLNAWLVPDLSNRDITTCAIKIKGVLTYVISAYFDINFDIDTHFINNVLSEIFRKNIPGRKNTMSC